MKILELAEHLYNTDTELKNPHRDFFWELDDCVSANYVSQAIKTINSQFKSNN